MFFLSVVDDRPTLKHLKFVRDNLCAACDTNPEAWKDLGRELISDGDVALGTIAANNKGNVATCCSKMLEVWLARDPKASWRQLIRALKEVELKHLAATIEEKLASVALASGHTTRTTSSQMPSSMLPNAR